MIFFYIYFLFLLLYYSLFYIEYSLKEKRGRREGSTKFEETDILGIKHPSLDGKEFRILKWTLII